MRAVLEFYNRKWAFPPLTLETLSHPSKVWKTERLLKKICWKIWELREMSGISSFIMEFLRTAVVSRESAGGTWPHCSVRPQISRAVSGSRPRGGGGGNMWRVSCQPSDAGCFECVTLTLLSQVQTPWVLGWAVSEKLICLCSFSNICLLPLSPKLSLQCQEWVS